MTAKNLNFLRLEAILGDAGLEPATCSFRGYSAILNLRHRLPSLTTSSRRNDKLCDFAP
jgi:hypothetical protein